MRISFVWWNQRFSGQKKKEVDWSQPGGGGGYKWQVPQGDIIADLSWTSCILFHAELNSIKTQAMRSTGVYIILKISHNQKSNIVEWSISGSNQLLKLLACLDDALFRVLQTHELRFDTIVGFPCLPNIKNRVWKCGFFSYRYAYI